MIQRMIILLICCACIGCAANKNSVSPEKLAALHSLIKSKEIHLTAERAFPMMSNSMQQVFNSELLGPNNSRRSIDLTTTNTTIKFVGDSIFVALPFFGELQAGAVTNPTGNGIAFTGVPTKDVRNYLEEKKQYKLHVDFKTKKEHFNMYVTIFPNGTSNVRVLSSHRSSMRYSARLVEK